MEFKKPELTNDQQSFNNEIVEEIKILLEIAVKLSNDLKTEGIVPIASTERNTLLVYLDKRIDDISKHLGCSATFITLFNDFDEYFVSLSIMKKMNRVIQQIECSNETKTLSQELLDKMQELKTRIREGKTGTFLFQKI